MASQADRYRQSRVIVVDPIHMDRASCVSPRAQTLAGRFLYVVIWQRLLHRLDLVLEFLMHRPTKAAYVRVVTRAFEILCYHIRYLSVVTKLAVREKQWIL